MLKNGNRESMKSGLSNFQREEDQKAKERIVHMAHELAKDFKRKNGKVSMADPYASSLKKKLKEAMKNQPFNGIIKLTQEKILNNEVLLGTMFYLDKTAMKKTKILLIGYQSLTENERKDALINSSVNFYNAEKIEKALKAKAEKLLSLAEEVKRACPKVTNNSKPKIVSKSILETIPEIVEEEKPSGKKRTEAKEKKDNGEDEDNGNGKTKRQKRPRKKVNLQEISMH